MATTGAGLAAVGAIAALLVQGAGPPVPGRGEGPAGIAVRLTGPDGEGWSWREREQAMRSLNAHYVGVEDEVLRFLRKGRPEAETEVVYGSPLHCALQTVGFWRIAGAENDLVARCGLRLIPSTVPVGKDMGASDFFPAARALAALPVRPAPLIAPMSAENHRVLTWVLATTQGKEAAAVLLERAVETGRHDTAALKAALDLLRTVEHEEDLLPRIDIKRDGK